MQFLLNQEEFNEYQELKNKSEEILNASVNQYNEVYKFIDSVKHISSFFDAQSGGNVIRISIPEEDIDDNISTHIKFKIKKMSM